MASRGCASSQGIRYKHVHHEVIACHIVAALQVRCMYTVTHNMMSFSWSTAACMQGLYLDALVPAALATSCPVLRRLLLHECTLPLPSSPPPAAAAATTARPSSSAAPSLSLPPLSAAVAAAAPAPCTAIHARLQQLSVTSTSVNCHTQLAVLARLPSLSSMELHWPDVPAEQL